MITYYDGTNGIEMVLMKRNPDYVYVHSCNAFSSWDDVSINACFKKCFPDACKTYKHWCKINNYKVAGKCLIVLDRDHAVGNLVTSNGVNWINTDSHKYESIICNAIQDLFLQLDRSKVIVAPAHNNELFGIEMQTATGLIKKVMDECEIHIDWRVYVID